MKEEITFEMAQELGLIPRLDYGFPFSLPFESAYGAEKRQEREERAYRYKLDRQKEKYTHVFFEGKKLKVI